MKHGKKKKYLTSYILTVYTFYDELIQLCLFTLIV